MVIGDFNLPVEKSHLEDIIKEYNLSSVIKKTTCYQFHTPSSIDLILTNRIRLFQSCNTFETGLSDHHKLICIILKSGGFKGTPVDKIYRSCKTFDVDQFQETLKLN